MTVALLAQTLGYLQGGGHFWVYLNWALGLRQNGARVLWLESCPEGKQTAQIDAQLQELQAYLKPYGLDQSVRLLSESSAPVQHGRAVTAEEAAQADLLVNFRYGAHRDTLRQFARTALIDIDPGLVQLWCREGQMTMEPHDFYFSISEHVGTTLPGLGLRWHHVFPCVSLPDWPVCEPSLNGAYTTITHWQGNEYVQEGDSYYANSKREAFLPFLDLPRLTRARIGLAACYHETYDLEEIAKMRTTGWHIEHAHAVSHCPESYRRYIQAARGEFSVCKPSCVRMQNAWVSDRTICFLASGKPAVVQHTGPSRFLPERDGLWRVRTVAEAAEAIDQIESHYMEQGAAARALAEKLFDARKNTARVLEICLS